MYFVSLQSNNSVTLKFSAMDIQQSVLGLAKSNNGFFKSEKQADFLIKQIELSGGYVGFFSSGYNSCPLFATTDSEGILKIEKQTKSGIDIIFERKVAGVLNSLQVKELKSLKMRLNKLEKELLIKVASWESGQYNRSGDKSTYNTDKGIVERYEYFKSSLENQITYLKNRINEY